MHLKGEVRHLQDSLNVQSRRKGRARKIKLKFLAKMSEALLSKSLKQTVTALKNQIYYPFRKDNHYGI